MEENVTRDADGIAVLPAEEPEHVTSLTPSGLEVYYSWAPRRHYKIRWSPDPVMVEVDPEYNPGVLVDVRERPYLGMDEWREIPSVTSVLNVLDKSGALSWWSQGVGAEGVLELARRGILVYGDGHWTDSFNGLVDKDDVVNFLKQEKLTINDAKGAASTRGLSVHDAFEVWSKDTSYRPQPSLYPEAEQGYIRGLVAFLDDLGEVEDVESEVMVGSIQHGFAGRFDVRLTLPEPREMVTRIYPVREAKRELVPAGRWLDDVKTSKRVYPSHAAQLAAYELASVECGYEPTDFRAVIHLTEDGRYELVRTYATGDDFLSILAAHNTMSRSKGWT